MTEVTTAPPTPPPPPPPPSESRYIDFAKPFTFVFQDPDWLKKILIGGLFYLAMIVLVGVFFVLGYCARLARNVVAGVPRPLPDWDDLGEYFVEGLKLAVIAVIYAIPLIAIIMIPVIGAGVAEGIGGGGGEAVAAIFGGVWCLMLPLLLVLWLWIPAALIFAAVSGRFEEGFNIAGIFGFIKNNFVNFLLAMLIHLVGNFVSQFGIILLCVGLLFTSFWSALVSTYAFADAYRMRRK